MSGFSNFELLKSLENTLSAKNITQPTEIQSKAIPLLMAGKSLVGVSETGSGKTYAYALPLLHKLKKLENDGDSVKAESRPRAIVITPTRELGEQISKVFKALTHETRLRVRPALGGMPLEQARRNISGPFEILLATPGRLVQLMVKKLIDLSDVRYLILDEADQMVDPTFVEDTNFVVAACADNIQMALFSATVSKPVEDLIKTLFANAQVIRSSGSGKVVSSLRTQNRQIIDGKRWPVFEKILNNPIKGGTLIFVNTRDQCDKLAKEMTEMGYECLVYRGELDKIERRANLKKFIEGKVRFLVSTDLGGRGLDIDHVSRVVNYHLPREIENYLHRVGRTARAGRSGLVINLVTERDQPLIDQLESQIGSSDSKSTQD